MIAGVTITCVQKSVDHAGISSKSSLSTLILFTCLKVAPIFFYKAIVIRRMIRKKQRMGHDPGYYPPTPFTGIYIQNR